MGNIALSHTHLRYLDIIGPRYYEFHGYRALLTDPETGQILKVIVVEEYVPYQYLTYIDERRFYIQKGYPAYIVTDPRHPRDFIPVLVESPQ
jgi:hypothetical protein